MDALVGHTGFVGGNLLRQHRFDFVFNSGNIGDIAGRSFSTLVFAGAQGKKWWANQNPEADWAGITTALDAMASVRVDHMVLISTIDVLPATAGHADEDFDAAAHPNHPYGLNRLRLEAALCSRFDNVTIVRLPGLIGRDLRKNIIFDLMNNNMVDRIDPMGRFQFYDLSRLWDDISILSRAGVKLAQLVTEPVLTADIAQMFFPGATLGPVPEGGSPIYDFRTKHAAIFGGGNGYLYGRDEVLRRMADFVTTEPRQGSAAKRAPT